MADKLTESLFLAANDFVERARQELSSVGDVPQRFGQTVDEYWTMCGSCCLTSEMTDH